MSKVRPIAIYLPQFHPIAENDEWWGKGFTEWTNVTKAKPLFKEHYQPHLPSDLGFYDLRLEEARIEQERMAKEYGIYGFCYYHYWFNGRLILEQPLQKKMKNPKEDLPFMMCWANENWSRRWDGSENEMLLEQNYSMEDHKNHIQYLMPFFKDPRHIRIDNKPVFAIYDTKLIPNLEEVLALWREEAQKEGLDLYLLRFESLGTFGPEYMCKGLDAATEFQPMTAIVKHAKTNAAKNPGIRKELSIRAVLNSLKVRKNMVWNRLNKINGGILDYKDIVNNDIKLEKNEQLDYKLYKCVCPGWDNTARKKANYLVLRDSTPELFGEWAKSKLKHFTPFSKEENLFFINAWNEWAEGNHLEPDRKWGKQYLEVLQKMVISESN